MPYRIAQSERVEKHFAAEVPEKVEYDLPVNRSRSPPCQCVGSGPVEVERERRTGRPRTAVGQAALLALV